jgi:hypothetical protein
VGSSSRQNGLANLRAMHSSDSDVFILPFIALKSLKNRRHNRPQKTYFLVRNRISNIELYCIDKGPNKWLREIELTANFVPNLQRIVKPTLEILESKETPSKIFVGSSKNNFRCLLSVKQFAELLSLITDAEGTEFTIRQENWVTQENLDKIKKETYLLLKKDERSYFNLYYYFPATKTKLHLLKFDKNDEKYSCLKQLTTHHEHLALYTELGVTNDDIAKIVTILRQALRGTDHISKAYEKMLRRQLVLMHTPKPALNSYQQARLVVVNIKQHIEELFVSALEPTSYQKYLVEARKDEQGRYIIPAGKIHANTIVDYQHFLNLLNNMLDFFDKTSEIHDYVIEVNGGIDIVIGMPRMLYIYSKWLKSYRELYGELIPLGVLDLVKELSAIEGWKKLANNLNPFIHPIINEQLQLNPFYISIINDASHWQSILQGTEQKLQALQSILKELNAKLPKGGMASETIQKTLDDIDAVIAAANGFNNSPKKVANMISLIYMSYPKFSSLLKGLPKSLVSLRSVFKDHVLMTLQQINLLFCQIVVNIDQTEIKYHLRENLILRYAIKGSSLESLLISFNELVEDAGYEFNRSEKFSYSHAKLQGRLALQGKYPDNSLVAERIDSLKIEIANHQEKAKLESRRPFYLKNKMQYQLSTIDQRISELEKSKNDLFAAPTAIRDIKIFLLRGLIRKLPFTTSIHGALDQVGNGNSVAREKIHLIWEGKTGKMLRHLLIQHQTSNTQIVTTIELEIDRLEKSRQQRQWWFIAARRKSVEESIFALQKFKKAVTKKGFWLTDALDELNAHYPQDYQILITKQKKLLRQLQSIESHLPKDDETKKPINYLVSKPVADDLTSHEIKIKYGYSLKEINARIAELNDEIKNAFYTSETKVHKILLLTELKVKLSKNTSLYRALDEIAKTTRFQNTYYLLREGRTGDMVKRLEDSSVSAEEKQDYLAVQIKRLQRLREKEYYFFESPEEKIEERIYVLTKFKNLMEDSPDSSIKIILSKMSPADLAILEQYESTTRTVMSNWWQAALEQKLYLLNIPEGELPIVPVPVPEVRSEQKPQSPPADEELYNVDIYKDTVTNLSTWQVQVAAIFKELLDKGIYEEFFENVFRDTEGRFDLNSDIEEPERVHQYKQFFNLLINARLFLEKLSLLHVPIMQYSNNKDIFALVSQITVLTELGSLTRIYYRLYDDVEQLDFLTFLQRLTSKDELRDRILNLLPVDPMAVRLTVEQNPILRAVRKQDTIWLSNATEINQKLDSIQEVLSSLEESLPPGKIARNAASHTVNDIIGLLKEVRIFAASPCKLRDVIKFVYAAYPYLHDLSQNSTQAFVSSSALFKDHVLMSVQQLNSIFCDIVVGLDRFKIVNFLKDSGQGEITSYEFKEGLSIAKVFETFHHWVNQLGYQFLPEEAYHHAILESRNNFVFESVVPKTFIMKRIHGLKETIKGQTILNEFKAQQELDDYLDTQDESVLELIDRRIAQLQDEMGKWWNFKKVKAIKISLLNTLKEHLQVSSVEESINHMESESDPALRTQIHYLFEGRTGKVIKKIQQIKMDKASVLRLVEHEIIRLTHDSNRFFTFKRKHEFAKSINGLKKLKAYLGKSGYRIDEALNELAGKYPDEYHAIKITQKDLLAEISQIDKQLPDFIIGKKTLDYCPTEKMSMLATFAIQEKYPVDSYMQQQLRQKIASLRAEVPLSYLGTTAKMHKIAMLEELSIQLGNNLLPDALEIISKSKKFIGVFHLLFEGRTGDFIKSLENVELTPAHILLRLDAEISYWRYERFNRQSFFQSRQQLQDRCIYQLSLLRNGLENNPQFPIMEFVASLSSLDQEIILKHEKPLLAELCQWQKTQREMQPEAAVSALSMSL